MIFPSFFVLAAEIETQDGVATLRGLEGLFENVVGVILGFAGIAVFLLLVAGGFKFITSGGDPKGVEDAKKTITYAIAGFVVIALAYLILVFIKQITGVDVTQFKIVQ